MAKMLRIPTNDPSCYTLSPVLPKNIGSNLIIHPSPLQPPGDCPYQSLRVFQKSLLNYITKRINPALQKHNSPFLKRRG
jgi:hypothetical protein